MSHSNPLGTHLDGEIHFFTPGKDILIIHTGYHHLGWDMPTGDEIRYMVQHPGPDREFAEWAKEKRLKCIGGEIDLLVNRRATIGFFPWRCVAMVDDDEYEELMARKAGLPKTRFGDGYEPQHVERINRLTRRY